MSYDEEEFQKDLLADADVEEEERKRKAEEDDDDLFGEKEDKEDKPPSKIEKVPGRFRCLDCRHEFTEMWDGMTPPVCPKCTGLSKRIEDEPKDGEERPINGKKGEKKTAGKSAKSKPAKKATPKAAKKVKTKGKKKR